MTGSAICYPDCPGPRTTTAFARRWRLCRGRTLKPVIFRGIAKQWPVIENSGDLLVFIGENRSQAWHCLETCWSRFRGLPGNGLLTGCLKNVYFVRSAFHLRASPSLFVRAGQRSQRAHPATRKPSARSKTHSRLPSGVVPCGTMIILGSDPALEALGYNTPPLPGLSRNLVNCFHHLA